MCVRVHGESSALVIIIIGIVDVARHENPFGTTSICTSTFVVEGGQKI